MSKKIIFFLFIFIAGINIASAQARQFTYQPLISGFPQPDVTPGKDFAGYFNQVMTLVIGLTGILAVLMIVIGGIQYVSTDSWNNKDAGKKRIQAAVGGLILALSSYLILNTIDPTLTNLNFAQDLKPVEDIKNMEGGIGVSPIVVPAAPTTPNTPGVDPSIPATNGTPGERPINENLTEVASGYEVTPSKVSMDNDGKARPPFTDTSWQNQTACQKNGEHLDAGVDVFVVVPLNSPFACHTPVTIRNNTTGQSISAFVGDRGPGYGEMSRAAAKALGLWTDDMGDAIKTKSDGTKYNITYTFHTK